MFEQAPLEYLVKVLRSQVPGFESRKVKGAEFPILAASPCLSLLWALRRRQPSVAEIQRLGLGKSIGALKKYAPEVTIQHAAQAVISAWMTRWKVHGTESTSSASSSNSSASKNSAGPESEPSAGSASGSSGSAPQPPAGSASGSGGPAPQPPAGSANSGSGLAPQPPAGSESKKRSSADDDGPHSDQPASKKPFHQWS